MTRSKFSLIVLFVTALFLPAGSLRAEEPADKPGVYMLFVWGTNDPAVRDGVEISRRKIEAAFVEDTSPYANEAESKGYYNSTGRLVELNPYIKEKRTLEGDDAHPQKILDACKELAEAAGPNDAVMVYILCHSATIKGRDGKWRHVLTPIATNARDLEMHKYGIARGSIMKAIKSKPHRLDMLITDSCEEIVRFEPVIGNEVPFAACIEQPYLTPFLLKAEGTLDIDSSRPETISQAEWRISLKLNTSREEVPSDPEDRETYEKYAGTVFTNAFLHLAKGYCNHETDYTVDAFFEKLRLELDYQFWETRDYLRETQMRALSMKASAQTLVRYDDNSEVYPQDLEFKSKYEEAYAKENDADATSL